MGKHKKSKHSKHEHPKRDSYSRKRSSSSSSNEGCRNKNPKSYVSEHVIHEGTSDKHSNTFKKCKRKSSNSNSDFENDFSIKQENKGDKSSCSSGFVEEHNVKDSNKSIHKKMKFIESKKNNDVDDNSEEEIMFDWKDHMWEINKLFFSDEDLIKKDSEDYKDFWKFLQKYQGLSKQKRIKDMCNKKELDSEDKGSFSPKFDLPLKYDKRYCINFAFKEKDWNNLQDRLPPIELDDKNVKRLSRKKITEFKFILLMYLDFMQKQRFNKLKKIREAQKSLPIYEYRNEILEKIENNAVTILAGDTGCGKSTQIPQYLLSAGYINIACTQPRRIACISLCKRVSYETLNEYGSSVGFQIRFEKSKTDHTKIVFLTEGLLLRQVASDPTLRQYNVVILDEIHERHLQTDFLLGVIKCLTVQRPDIKVILMSATINIDLFSNYFMGTAPVIQIPGRLYPIELKYLPISIVEKSSKTEKINPSPYVRVLQLIDHTYPADERGDLLIFLSGIKEITTIVEAAKLYAQKSNKWVILPLHSTLSVSEQEKVFDIPPEGIRKCIVSTNIAETSVTIDGVRFVVDSGKVKEMSFDPVHKMQKLKEFWISQASAEQRKGRSGRTGPGVCFRMYSETEYSAFSPYTTPEILRVPLDSLILQMISMGLPNIKLFPFIEPPSTDTLEASLQTLKSHSALTADEELTSIGQLLAQLPLDVSLGKMLIMGSLFHKLGPVLSLAAAMSVQSPFTNRAYRDPDCVVRNKNLLSNHGDPFTLLIAYREWLYIKTTGSEDSRRWCRKRGLEEQRFYEMTKLRQQFSQMLQESGLRNLTSERGVSNSLERARRYGELYQLKQMKRELYKQGPRKSQVLKVDSEGGVMELEEDQRDVGLELKDLDFKIRYDDSKLHELYKDSKMDSFKDVVLLKLILCCGLYPNLAIADEHNNYKSGSEQLFHTPSKPFAVLHPNSIFSSEPETLEINQPDILNSSEFSDRHPCSNKHQLLAFVSLLETNKAYLVNTLRTPAAQTLLLFARNVYTNVDISTLVCDDFIEMKFADRIGAQNLLFQAVILRFKWKELLEMRIRAAKSDDPDKLAIEIRKLESELSSGLIDIFVNEQFYSCRRLLAADVKVLHYGPGPGDMVLTPNPFSEEEATCLQNTQKGGVILTPFLTYNSLIDVNTNVTSITSYDAVCPYCDKEFHFCTLERFCHMMKCLENISVDRRSKEEDDSTFAQSNPNNKEFWCEVCRKKFFLSIKEILKHKKSHS